VADVRPVRADARRNRHLLVETARRVFALADARVPLEVVAREAGVGIGTLYRHFPTREALIEAVYEAELDDVTTSGSTLLAAHPDAADIGLRAWMDRYAAFVAMKHGLVDTLRAGWSSGAGTTPRTRERITGVIAAFLEAGAQQGVLRGDVLADDVTASLLGVLLSTAGSGTPQQVPRLLDLLLDALRPRPSPS
jgi:AcrR family transcriptional regulator